ncbi:MAG: 1-acyl-sn-glycerol-3-phosphate acyltransferase [Candidatus Kapabacteria bacterium]|nr:1-acyl-sn-glycerol-3-phosphate acyltransferase [Candidatus Kapabacteria bacterium]
MIKKIVTISRLILIALVTIFFAFATILLMLIFGKHHFHRLAAVWSKLLLIISGIKVKLITPGGKFPLSNVVYISNHSSLFDIPVLLSSLKDNARIMYKEELEKIPIFGWCLKMSPFLSVKREDPENAMQSFRHAVQSISDGDSVIIFPEGTRSEDGTLGQFKKGAFLLATKSGKAIVTLAIKGTSEVMPKGKFEINPQNVTLTYVKQFDIEHIRQAGINTLMNETFDLMKQNLNPETTK